MRVALIMDDNLMACVNTMGLDIISPNKIFVPHTYRMVVEENKNKNELNIFADSLINLVLVRDNGQCMKYTFIRSIHDLDNTKYLEERHYYNSRVARKYTHYDIDVCRTFKFDDKKVQRDHGYFVSSGIDHRG